MFLKIKFTLFLLFVFAIVTAQTVLEGEAKSAIGSIIPSASVQYLHHKAGGMTDTTGRFKLLKIVGDTLQISSVGYAASLFSIQENTGFLQAILTENTKVLREVTVSTKKMKTVSLGYYSGLSLFHDYGSPGRETSVLIPNKDHVEGYINEIRFKLTNAENSPWNLRIRLREVDTVTGFPSNSLPVFDATIPASQLTKANRIDIKDKYISLPQAGIFTTLEWLDVDAAQKIAPHLFVTPAIPGKKVSERRVFFRYTKSTEWQSSISPDNPNSYFASNEGKNLYAPNISILVSVPKK